MTVASRRALCTQAKFLARNTVVSFANSSWLLRLCFWCWRVAVAAWRAEADALSELDAVNLASRQLRAVHIPQLPQ